MHSQTIIIFVQISKGLIVSIVRQSHFKNGGKMFLQKFGKQLPDNTVSHPIKKL